MTVRLPFIIEFVSLSLVLEKGLFISNTIVATEVAFNETTHTQLIKVGESTATSSKISAKGSSAISLVPQNRFSFSASKTIDPTYSFITTWYDPAHLIVIG